MTIGRNYAFKDPKEIDLALVLGVSQERLRKKSFEVGCPAREAAWASPEYAYCLMRSFMFPFS